VTVGRNRLDSLTDAELLALLDALAGDPRTRRLGWRLREAAPPATHSFTSKGGLPSPTQFASPPVASLPRRRDSARAVPQKTSENARTAMTARVAALAAAAGDSRRGRHLYLDLRRHRVRRWLVGSPPVRRFVLGRKEEE
jgi:hypothetical protein